MSCNLCGASRYALVYRGPLGRGNGYRISEAHVAKPERVVRCVQCGLVYAINGDTAAIVADYERMEDADYLDEEAGRRAQARIVLKQIARYKRAGRLLDVGCGPGIFLDEARKAGFHVQGIDLSAWAVAHAGEAYGVDVVKGPLERAAFADRTFDVVVMNDLLEHVENPLDTLREVRRVMKSDAVLYLSTPDFASFSRRLLGMRWWGINRYHLYYFCKKTLRTSLRDAGLVPMRYVPYPRIFSWKYWTRRVATLPLPVRAPFAAVARLAGKKEALLRIDLRDQIGVVARKARRLENVGDEEAPARRSMPARPRIVAVLPAWNAARTLARTVADIPRDVVDEIVLVDDASRDDTVRVARELGLTVYRHDANRGYGGNQKTCYEKALEHGADVVVMCHPDYQYDPRIIPELVGPIVRGEADAVFGSRMMKGGALEGGMPLWKHNANILLTAFENVCLGTYLTEYHSGFRAYSADLLRRVNFQQNSDGFIFDTEIIVQILANHMKIEEIPIRTRYFEEASTIGFRASVVYGLGIIRVMAEYALHARGWARLVKYESRNA